MSSSRKITIWIRFTLFKVLTGEDYVKQRFKFRMTLIYICHFLLVATCYNGRINVILFQVFDKGNNAWDVCVIHIFFKLNKLILYFMLRLFFIFKIPIEYLSQCLSLDKMGKMRYVWFVNLTYPIPANGILRLGIQYDSI